MHVYTIRIDIQVAQHYLHIKQDSGRIGGFFLRIHTTQATTYSGLLLYGALGRLSYKHFLLYATAFFVDRGIKGREPTQSPLPWRINHPSERYS